MAAQVSSAPATRNPNPIDLRDPALRCGAKVVLVLTTGETIEGHVHSSDQTMRLLLVKLPLVGIVGTTTYVWWGLRCLC